MTELRDSHVDAATLVSWLGDGEELALLDAHEEGVFSEQHLFHAVCVPLSHLELELDRLVPRRSTRVVWCDGGLSGLAERAVERSVALGWTNCVRLDGGTLAWREAGFELYSGVNVPSKALGELVEHTYGTPRLSASELNGLLADGANVTVLDSRPMAEYRRMSIPTGIDCPGAELVYRVKEVVTDTDTLVVVNCAGRTRSIIGAQSLINAGLENRVMALENGTMGWELAGLETASGHETHAPDPGLGAQRWSTAAAARVAERFDVQEIDTSTLAAWQSDPDRTTYLLDVRTDAEFEAGHLAGSVHAPGGQLVQATDAYVGTRNARLVLVDNEAVRAPMTASWLRQLGWTDAVVLTGGVSAQRTENLVTGKTARSELTRAKVPVIRPPELAAKLESDHESVTVIDVGTSIKYRTRGHIPSAWWAVRSRLAEARTAIGDAATIVFTANDSTLAKLAAADAATHWPEADIMALAAGNKGWRHAGFAMEEGFDRATTAADDVWYKPYDHDPAAARKFMEDYLTWEIALVEQIERDETVSFPTWG